MAWGSQQNLPFLLDRTVGPLENGKQRDALRMERCRCLHVIRIGFEWCFRELEVKPSEVVCTMESLP
jgi:hypothetical protein